MALMNRSGFLLLFFLLVCGSGHRLTAAQGTIVLQTRYPTQFKNTRILVHTPEGNPVFGALVKVTYRPGSRVEVISDIGETDEAGGVNWAPDDVGIVTISAHWLGDDGGERTAATNISVKYASTPMSGILIMLLAGILLIGGSIYRFSRYIWGKKS